MAARAKKERRKEKKRREKYLQKKSEAAGVRSSLIAENTRLDSPAPKPAPQTFEPRPQPKPRERTPEEAAIDRWWDEYEDSDGDGKMRLVREKLATVQPGDEWRDEILPEAIAELEPCVSTPQFVAFLEELHADHPDVFAKNADWNARSIAFHCAAEKQWEALDRAVIRCAEELTEVKDPFFSLMSLVRLAGRRDAARRLIEAAYAKESEWELMPWAVDELIDWAMFETLQECINKGATDEAIDAAFERSIEFGVNDSNEVRQTQREYVLRLAGRTEGLRRDELRKGGKLQGPWLYLLLADYTRWLCATRGFEPVVADELARILFSIISSMESKPKKLFAGLRRDEFEPVLARKFGFLSLNALHAPAGAIAMAHFYDFLAESDRVDAQIRKSAHVLCDTLLRDMKNAMKADWRNYEFLEAYLPPKLP